MAEAVHETDSGAPSRRRQETLIRVASGLAFAVPAAVAFYVGWPLFPVFVGAIAAVMAWEWMRVCGDARFGVVGAVLLGGLVAAVALAASAPERYPVAFAAVAGLAAAVWAVARANHRRHAYWLAFGALYIGVPSLALLWLYQRPDLGRAAALWIILVVVATDIGAYFVGRAVKGPKLAPRVSPGKTWSGLLGGIAAAAITGAVAAAVEGQVGVAAVALASAGLAVVAQAGDLFESAVKRTFGVKDTSRLIPGHGGMMDRVDGMVAAIAAAALVVLAHGGEVPRWS
jgi:phosphatidate cytidylyltransferase